MKDLRQYILEAEGDEGEEKTTQRGKIKFVIWEEPEKKVPWLDNNEKYQKIEYKHEDKDKNIFIMCGGGGYAGSMKNMLIALGWNPQKIYNVGGYWCYKGSNNVQVKEEKNNKISYAFWKVSYHNIDFSNLTEVSK